MRRLFRKKDKSAEDVRRIVAFVQQNGGIEAATNHMDRLATQAREQLLSFPDTDARATMDRFLTFVIARTK